MSAPLVISRLRLSLFGVACILYGGAVVAVDALNLIRIGLGVLTLLLWPATASADDLERQLTKARLRESARAELAKETT